jgi:hypothetical protein
MEATIDYRAYYLIGWLLPWKAPFCMLRADFLLALLFSPKNRGKMIPETLLNFYRATQHYIPDDSTVYILFNSAIYHPTLLGLNREN